MASFESDSFDADMLNGTSSASSSPVNPPVNPNPIPDTPLRTAATAPQPQPQPAQPKPQPQQKPQPQPAARPAENPAPQPQQQSGARIKAAEVPKASRSAAKSDSGRSSWNPSVRLGALAGVVLLLVAAYLFITMISSLTNGIADESVVANKSLAEVAGSDSHIANTCGPFGAYLAHLLFTRWIGMGIFVLIYYMGALGVSLVGFHKFNFWKLSFNCIISAVCVSVIVGLAAYLTDSLTYWGGYFGYYVNDFLVTQTGIWGAIGVNVFLLAVLGFIFYELIHRIWRVISGWINRYRAVMAARHQAAIEAQLRADKLREAEQAAADAEAAAEAAEREAEAAEREALAAERIAAAQRAAQEAIASVTPDPVASSDFDSDLNPEPETESASGSDMSTYIPLEHSPYAPTFTEIISDPLPAPTRTPLPAQSPVAAPTEVSASANPTESTDLPELPSITEESAPAPSSLSSETAEKPQTPESRELPEIPEIPEAIERPTTTPLLDAEAPIPDPLADLAALVAPVTTSPEIDDTPEQEPEHSHAIGTPYDPREDLSRYRMPSLDLLRTYEHKENRVDIAEQEENKERITRALQSYGIEIAHIEATVGATITLYEIVPAPGVRIAKIKKLGDDMAMSLQALGIRIIAPIPGKGTIGMEVPNREPQIIGIREILSSDEYINTSAHLPIAMGTTITNDVYVADLAKTPHLLVAGATGMGKSVGLNCIIASLLYKLHPAELKFVLIDPKQVEFSLYSCIRNHYLAMLPDEEDPIITEPSRVVGTLNSLVQEMENRYALLKKAQKRNIVEYNTKFIERSLSPAEGHRFMPYIVVIIDEFGDLMITVGKEIENPVSRIAAKARAVGIHMILATQRPSVDVITGVIKANFPARMAFAVSQPEDSRTILGRTGAEQLIGRGDMLISIGGKLNRVQCAFIDTDEVESICHNISDQIGYPTPYELPPFIPEGSDAAGGNLGGIGDRDPLFEDAARAIIESGVGSTSYLQRKFTIGYPRAGKIMDQLEMAGVVGPAQGGKPRKVLMDFFALESMLG